MSPPPECRQRWGYHVSLGYSANNPDLNKPDLWGELWVETILKLHPRLEKAGPNISSPFAPCVKL